MEQQKICQNCSQKSDCQTIYQKLGSSKGPSVVLKAVVAFLLPILVFIACLAAFERILAKTIDAKELQILFNFLLSSLVTFVLILIIRAINKTRAHTDSANTD